MTNEKPFSKLVNRFLIESRWLFVGVIASALAISLWTYNHDDPAWSHSIDGVVANKLGKLGALTADVLLYTFGLSSWWLVILLIIIAWRGLNRIKFLNWFVNTPSLVVIFAGFSVVLLSSAALETLRFHSFSLQLPFESGGFVGVVIADLFDGWLGYTGSSIFFIVTLAIGWQYFTGMSWILLSERIGLFLENTTSFYAKVFEQWQDRRIGKSIAQEREANVMKEKQRAQGHEPIVIATPTKVDLAPKIVKEINKAKPPVVDTRQLNLFDAEDLPPTSDDQPQDQPNPARHQLQDQLQDQQGEFPDQDLAEQDSPDSPITADTAEMPQPQSILTRQVPHQPQQQASSQAQSANPATMQHYAAPVPKKPVLPSVTLLDAVTAQNELPPVELLEFTSRLIERKLAEFRVEVKVISALPGPVVTRYEIEPAVGVKGSQIINLERDLARALALISVRIVETVPGKTCMALELPNAKRQIVKLIEIIATRIYQESPSLLTVCLGKDISGLPIVADLGKMPHLLVAGTTGSGKSVGVNAMILSLLYKALPEQVRLIMIDPKMLELSIYEGIPHLLAPVVTDMKQAASALNWCVMEMEKRYKLMSVIGVRNIAGLNEKIRQADRNGRPLTNPFSLTPEDPEPIPTMPFIVVIIDELADLMMVVGKKVEELIARLAQKARAAGIHLILATQRPSVDVITGLIKANVPTRLSFQVSSKIDSRTILDQMGAETLLGQGDMLYLPAGSGYPNRVHGAYVSDDEVHRVVNFLKTTGEPDYIDGILTGGIDVGAPADGEKAEGGNAEKDPLYDRAVEIVVETRRASISLVQRHLRVGYNRAARLVEAMEEAGIVSRVDERGGREVLVKPTE